MSLRNEQRTDDKIISAHLKESEPETSPTAVSLTGSAGSRNQI